MMPPNAGYAFLEFRTHEAADMLLKSYNGQPIPGTDQVFRLNWAAYGVGKAQPAGEGTVCSETRACLVLFLFLFSHRALQTAHLCLWVIWRLMSRTSFFRCSCCL